MLLFDEIREAWRGETRDHRVALVVIGVLAVALRLVHLGQPMRYDEAVTYLYFVKRPVAEALSIYTYPNNHLFHTLLAKASVTVFGNSPWALRLPALLAGVLVVSATYAVTRTIYGARAALLAAAIAASSGVLTLYSTNARGYSLVVLAFLLLVLTAIRLLRGAPASEWLRFAAIGALGLWTIPVMLYPLGTVCLWVALSLLVEHRNAELKRLATAIGVVAGLTLLAYSPVIAREGIAAITRNPFVVSTGWFEFFEQLAPTIREALASWALGTTAFSVLLAACAIVALRRHATISQFRVGLPVAAFAWCAWLLVVTHRAPFARIWLWLYPLAAALAGAGVVRIMESRARTRTVAEHRVPVLAMGLALAMALSVILTRAVLTSRDTGTYRDAEQAAAVLGRVLQPGDRVFVAVPGNAPLSYYLDRLGVPLGHFAGDERRASRVLVVVDRSEGQTPSSVIGASVVSDTAQFTKPAVVAKLPASEILVYHRRDAATK